MNVVGNELQKGHHSDTLLKSNRSVEDPLRPSRSLENMANRDVKSGEKTATGPDGAGGEEPPRSAPKSCGEVVRKNLLIILLVVALLMGILIGALARLRPEPYSKREILNLRFPGELLMNMLQMLILPLIVSSLISGMTMLDARASGRMGLRAVVYYLTTTLAAVILGIILVVSIQPGKRGDKPARPEGMGFRKVDPVDTFLDLIRQMFPDNIVEATFQKTLTRLRPVVVKPPTTTKPPLAVNLTASTPAPPEPQYEPVLERVRGINMLGLVVFSLAMGIAINSAGDKGLPLKILFESLAEVTLVLVRVVIWYSPLGVLFLVLKEVVSMTNPRQTFEQLSFYFVTVVVGLIIHGFITLPAIYFFFVRKNPYKFIYGMLQALITALGTSSSNATLPVTMRNLEENNHVDPRITGFVAPIGATINMDGTALYEAVAVIFIGQVEGFDLGIGNIIVVCLTATAASIGAAGVPQAGLVTMVIVLTAVGFPNDRVSLILAIDWLLDRFRTAINVLGDAIGAGIVHHLSRDDLQRMDEEDRQKMELQILRPEVKPSACAKIPMDPAAGALLIPNPAARPAALSDSASASATASVSASASATAAETLLA